MNVYLIPGLGGDKRMYAGQLNRFPNTKVLEFITPLKKEKISAYADRLAEGIDKTEPFILIGVSLGGILTQEIAKLYPPIKSIIISSVKSRKELPLWMRFFKYFPLQKILPGTIYLWAFMVLIWFKTLFTGTNNVVGNLKAMAKDVNPDFVYWAVDQIVKWQNPIADFKPFHIHGSKDFLFPLRRLKNVDKVIDNGTHVMILTDVATINRFLKQELEDGVKSNK